MDNITYGYLMFFCASCSLSGICKLRREFLILGQYQDRTAVSPCLRKALHPQSIASPESSKNSLCARSRSCGPLCGCRRRLPLLLFFHKPDLFWLQTVWRGQMLVDLQETKSGGAILFGYSSLSPGLFSGVLTPA